MPPRFYLAERLPAQGELSLPDAIAHHAFRVLRLREGDAVVLFDGHGGEARARLALRGKTGFAVIEEYDAVERESPLAVVLVQGLAGGDKMDWIVQKAVELGVAGVVPLAAERSVLKLHGERAEKRREHWRQVAIAACEQCGRNRVPEIVPVATLAAWLAAHRDVAKFVLMPGGEHGVAGLVRPEGVLYLLIGPEGGWSEDELALCRAAGCIGLRFGPRVLRTETAGLAALAALQTVWGDFS